jgi:hypothetical protein
MLCKKPFDGQGAFPRSELLLRRGKVASSVRNVKAGSRVERNLETVAVKVRVIDGHKFIALSEVWASAHQTRGAAGTQISLNIRVDANVSAYVLLIPTRPVK